MSDGAIAGSSGLCEASGEKRKKIKHILVDPDTDLPIIRWKRTKLNLDATKKSKILQTIVDMYKWISTTYFEEDPEFTNITLGMQLTDILFTSLSMKQQQILSVSEENSSPEEYRVRFAGQIRRISAKIVAYEWIIKAKAHGLEFKASEDNTWNAALTYLNYFTGFKLRFNELKLGHSMFCVGKIRGKNQAFRVSKYGIGPHYHSLLDGCTFPPQKRSSMVQVLGPLTVLLEYIRAKTTEEIEKWKEACKDAMCEIPHIDTILQILREGSEAEICELIEHLAKVLRIKTTRQPLRLFLPLNCIANLDKLFTAGYGIGNSVIKDMNIPHGSRDDFFGKINLRGIRSIFLYTIMCKAGPFKLDGEWKKGQAEQVVFHTIMGTSQENSNLLSWITPQYTWFNRHQLKKGFFKNKLIDRTFELIPLLRYFKIAYDQKPKTIYPNYDCQLSSCSVFSGFTTRKFSDKFSDYMHIQKKILEIEKFVQNSIPQLITYLNLLKEMVLEDLTKQGYKKIERITWFKNEGLTFDEDGPEIDEVPVLFYYISNTNCC